MTHLSNINLIKCYFYNSTTQPERKFE